jgi:hypothetical protein
VTSDLLGPLGKSHCLSLVSDPFCRSVDVWFALQGLDKELSAFQSGS